MKKEAIKDEELLQKIVAIVYQYRELPRVSDDETETEHYRAAYADIVTLLYKAGLVD